MVDGHSNDQRSHSVWPGGQERLPALRKADGVPFGEIPRLTVGFGDMRGTVEREQTVFVNSAVQVEFFTGLKLVDADTFPRPGHMS